MDELKTGATCSDPQPPNLGGSADVIIIGAGPGGYRAAELAAKAGLKVVIFEQGHVGGTCLNEGCIPTKTYVHSATFAEAVERQPQVVQQLRAGVEQILSHPNITLVRAEARFVDAHTVEALEVEYSAPYIIIATGSVPKCLPIEGASLALDSRDLLQLDHLPESLCIIGAGVIGMEFASIFNTFGSKVTVVEFLKECLPALDSDIAKRLRKVLEKRGVEFCLQSAVTGIRSSHLTPNTSLLTPNSSKTVTFTDKKGKEQTLEAEEVLMAVGRAPRVYDHFRNAGFDYDVRSGIKVDDHFETTVKGIYAIGDCNGRQMLAHAAEAQAKAVVEHILSLLVLNHQTTNPQNDQTLIPAAIFTKPEAACVGPGEDQLKAAGTLYECRKAFYRANGKALAMNETEGMLKLFSELNAGRILGCHVFGAHSADLVQEASVLMYLGATVAQLRQMVHIHPTLSELLLSAAEID
ncbi:MAG: NAD(P)/FAD-dependent oxidoreductase [Prevotella sp.]|nr:NAD(P)/FAD-dependent oxidoreductase [Prevotella sp.]